RYLSLQVLAASYCILRESKCWTTSSGICSVVAGEMRRKAPPTRHANGWAGSCPRNRRAGRMSEGISTTQSDARAIDTTLVALGFVRGDDDVLYAPSDSVVSFTSVGGFLELRIVLGDGNAVTAVLSKTALKFSRAGGKS